MNFDIQFDLSKAKLFDFIDRYADAALRGNSLPSYEPFFYVQPKPTIYQEPKKPRRKISATLSDLLDDIEETFSTITKPLGYCGIEHDTRIGLRRLGPHVIARSDYGAIPEAIDDPERLSGMMFVAFPHAASIGKTEDKSPASFYYAIKVNRQPQGVEPVKGTVFEFGYCADFIKRTQWDSAYVVVKNDGTVHVCKQLFFFPRTTKAGTYWQKRSDIPIHNLMVQGSALSRDERSKEIARDFMALVAGWRSRSSMWSVSVRRNGNRATFCVPPKETKDYFKNRDKTALTPQGKRRPIFHFVREFERELANGKRTTVREHTRGLRTFNWNGYVCAITAPKFHKWTEQGFTLSALIEEDMKDDHSPIFSSKFGGMLADMEDKQLPPMVFA